MFDLLRTADPETINRVTAELHDALARRRFTLIMLDKMEPWLEADLNRYYERSGEPFAGDGLWTRTGYLTRPRLMYTPQGP